MALYFADQGLDESVLQELQQMWEQKLYTSKVGNFPALPYQESFITSTNEQRYSAANLTAISMQQQDPFAQFRLGQTDGQLDDEEEDDEDGLDSEGKDSELDDEEEDEQTDHIILCQFEKVTRIKNKWKCILKDGIMNINGKDYLFNKANGDFEW